MNQHPHCAVFGGLLLDRYFELDRFPRRGGDAVIRNEYDLVGGCAINMAAAFENLGGQAHIVASLGQGPMAGRIRAYLQEHGLSQRFIAPADTDAGYCYVFLEPDGERTFMTRDSLGFYPAALVEEGMKDMDCAAVTGYYLLEEPKAVADTLCRFAERGGLVLYDPGPMGLRLDKEARHRVMDAAAVITAGEEELDQLPLPGHENKIIVIKKGAAGGTVYHPGGRFDYPASPAELVDGTGAGDAFAGGLLFGLAAGMALKESVSLAARCAAKTVEILGPHGFWTREDL